ncbi:hypothetical protein BZG36_00723 [Bifiguratus adelaidae]|uniref:E3 ubiquitin-protein ligase PEP5 n=1 Tax=Bifiguratus adelaidae TaxID=1938954 RepID=A0A261Y6W2_9FUNG|nr:hypothetical protein BZG36_00723 [Bifiguratus adelaidae]
MSLVQWRQFNFFDLEKIDLGDDTEVFKDIVACTSAKEHIILADSRGQVHLIDKDFNVSSFVAFRYGKLTHMKQLKTLNVLVTIGEESRDTPPIVKLWDLERKDAKSAASIDGHPAPVCTRTLKMQHVEKGAYVTTFAVLDNLSQLAIGFSNGSALLLRGDIGRDRSVKQKLVTESSIHAITGLGFDDRDKHPILYIVTSRKISYYNTSESRDPIKLDDQGCALNCAISNEHTKEMVLARNEAIYFYDQTGRGACFAYDIPKSSVTYYKSNYLVIVTPPAATPAPVHLSKDTRSEISLRPTNGLASFQDRTKVTIFDTANKFVAYVGEFDSQILGILGVWNTPWVVGSNGHLWRLNEVDNVTKMDTLFKKNLYLLAINLAHSQSFSDANVAEIFQKYGDHLYSKADYEGAMQQYIRTIGHLEPSYVIRKYLDAQRISNLASYLQALHSAGLAKADHTTLLINCYAELKDNARLEEFIKAKDENMTFDVETAIRVCKESGFYDYAVFLAAKFEQNDLYMDILMENKVDYEAAIKFIRKQTPSDASRYLLSYGKKILHSAPLPTTQLFIDLCTGHLKLESRPPSRAQSPTKNPLTQHLGMHTLAQFTFPRMDSTKKTQQSPERAISPSGEVKSPKSPEAVGSPVSDDADTGFKQPAAWSEQTSVSKFTALFVERPDCLLAFLEEVKQRKFPEGSFIPPPEANGSMNGSIPYVEDSADQGRERERLTIFTALFELYLMNERVLVDDYATLILRNDDGTLKEVSKTDKAYNAHLERCKTKAMTLLKNATLPYDMNQALVLCHLKDFEEGIVYINERMEQYTDILRHFMDKGDTKQVVASLQKYGSKDPSVYTLTLSYFTSTPEILEQCKDQLLHAIHLIDAEDLLPSLEILKSLGQSSVATVELVSDYLSDRIEKSLAIRKESAQVIAAYREDIAHKREEIAELKNNATIFQVTRCSACGNQLDLPSIHFMCKHSYHSRCLPESDRECPKCLPQYRVLEQEEQDGFGVIADYFSKNTLAFTKLID